MRRIIILWGSLIALMSGLLSACAPSPQRVQAALFQTQTAWTPVPTLTPYPTYTRYPTATRYPTYTPYPTYTKVLPTHTPTASPTPPFAPQTIGPIWDSWHDTSYSVEVSITNVRWLERGLYSEPKAGNVYVIVDLTVKNLGPGSINNFGSGFFKVLDANGVLKDDDYTSDVEDCHLDYVDLMPNGTSAAVCCSKSRRAVTWNSSIPPTNTNRSSPGAISRFSCGPEPRSQTQYHHGGHHESQRSV